MLLLLVHCSDDRVLIIGIVLLYVIVKISGGLTSLLLVATELMRLHLRVKL